MKVDWLHAYEIERRVQEIITRQRLDGWQFDRGKAERYVDWLEGYTDLYYKRIRPVLRKILILPYNGPINNPFLKEGGYTSNVIKWMEGYDENTIGGPFTRIRWEEPNLRSDKQLKVLLFELGWKPTQWNYKKDKAGRRVKDTETKRFIKTSPKLTEDSYDSLESKIGQELALYLKAKHRKSQLEGFLRHTDDDNLIHAVVNTLGTPTGRMIHQIVVNVPKAKPHVFFGYEMRDCFIARPGRMLVGHDAAGLEARIMGHYLNDGDLIYELIHGDFHTKFWNPLKEFVSSRDNAKNVEYALVK